MGNWIVGGVSVSRFLTPKGLLHRPIEGFGGQMTVLLGNVAVGMAEDGLDVSHRDAAHGEPRAGCVA